MLDPDLNTKDRCNVDFKIENKRVPICLKADKKMSACFFIL